MLKDKELKNLIFRKKPRRILLVLAREMDRTYTAEVAKKSKTTYSHTHRLLDRLEDKGLIEYEKVGRMKCITPTKKGEEILELTRELVEKMDGIE